ncbi:MFS transporter [Streptomyces sp. NPDC059917]|uniref:MFS transporter n=1 Tax=Streptomyces sp. NPDC059917 TaxID=3347002 RepID=UPI00365E9EFF
MPMNKGMGEADLSKSGDPDVIVANHDSPDTLGDVDPSVPPARAGDPDGADQQVFSAGFQGVVTRLAIALTPPTPALRTYALASLVTSLGTGLYTTGAIVFFVRSLHLSAGFVGASLTVAAAVGLLSSLPAGRFVDRRSRSAKQALVFLFGVQAVFFALFPLVRGQVAFVAVIVGIALAQNAAIPVRGVLLSDLAGGRSRVVAAAAYNRMILNVGMSVGALLAAVALAADSQLAYNMLLWGNAASLVGAGALLSRVRVPPLAKAAAPEAEAESVPDANAEVEVAESRHPLRQPRFAAASVICGTLYLSAAILDVALPLQVALHSQAPRWIISVLLMINTVLAVTLQVRVSRGSETVSGAAQANRLAGIALFVCCLLFPLVPHLPAAVAIVVLIVVTLLLTAGELYSSAGSWGLSYGLAPPAEQGKYLASFGLLSQSVVILGPLLASAVVVAGLPGWVVLGAVFLGSGLVSPVILRQK